MSSNPITQSTQSSSPPPDFAAMQRLSTAELAAIAQDEMSAGDATRLQWLLEENADNALSMSERAELATRAAAADYFTRRKEYAATLLAQR
jgi:hypothetical protein